MTYRIAEGIALGHAEPRPRHGWVGDAPANADEVLASVRVLPRWVGLAVALVATIALWAMIFLAARWGLHALS